MKLSTLVPNAHYDMVHGKPETLVYDNDGSAVFRFNIAPEYGIKEGEKEETQIGWSCYEVRTFARPTKANLKRAIIRSVVDESAEFDLVNSYNKHVLGITKDEEAVAAYKEYLTFTEDLDALLVRELLN